MVQFPMEVDRLTSTDAPGIQDSEVELANLYGNNTDELDL